MEFDNLVILNTLAILFSAFGLFYFFYEVSSIKKFLAYDLLILHIVLIIVPLVIFSNYMRNNLPLEYSFLIGFMVVPFIASVYYYYSASKSGGQLYVFWIFVLAASISSIFEYRYFHRELSLVSIILFVLFVVFYFVTSRYYKGFSDVFKFMMLKAIFIVVISSFYIVIQDEITLDLQIFLPVIILLSSVAFDYRLFMTGGTRKRKTKSFNRR